MNARGAILAVGGRRRATRGCRAGRRERSEGARWVAGRRSLVGCAPRRRGVYPWPGRQLNSASQRSRLKFLFHSTQGSGGVTFPTRIALAFRSQFALCCIDDRVESFIHTRGPAGSGSVRVRVWQ